MGHATALVKLELTELPSNPSATAIMDAAVEHWRDYEADNRSDARYSYVSIESPASEAVAESSIEDWDAPTRSRIIPLTEDYVEKTSTKRLQVNGRELTQLRQGNTWELREAGRFGSEVVKVEIIQLPKPRAPRAEATPGKAITAYKVVDSSRRTVQGLGAKGLKPSYPSQAEARAAAIGLMAAQPSCAQLAVEAFIERDTGSAALVTITRPEPETSTATFKVTTQKVKPKPKITGYLVAFDYHH